MRTLIWLVLFVVGLVGVLVPLTYLYAASKLPPLDSEFDLERQLRQSVEGERMSLQLGTMDRGKVTYEHPDFSKLPKDVVAIFISNLDCPTYFRTPRETGRAWTGRLVSSVFGLASPPGDGGCELFFAESLAHELGVHDTLELAVASNRIHGFLQKDQLLAYYVTSHIFERGVVGLEAASQKLLHRNLDSLSLAQAAELSLAIPPNNDWEEVKQCSNAGLIQRARDNLLDGLRASKLASSERVEEAKHEGLTCMKVQ